jgi:hypothetical protein
LRIFCTQVCSDFVPKARLAWEELAELTLDLTIPISLLNQTYGRLESSGQITTELRVLASTVDLRKRLPLSPSASPPVWARAGGYDRAIRAASEHLQDFLLLKKLSSWCVGPRNLKSK